MTERLIGNPRVKAWFDDLESSLRIDARRAGLLDHSTLMGDGREWFIKNVLESVLPPSIHIGRGMGLKPDGSLSNQLDVVVYDPRFPRFKLGDSSLYLTEGIIASIEVKSSVDATQLADCLRKSASLIDRSVRAHPDDLAKRVAELRSQYDGDEAQAKNHVLKNMLPRSYVFGFRGSVSPERCAEVVDEYVRESKVASVWDSRIPRVIVAGDVLGIARDQRRTFEFAPGTFDSLQKPGIVAVEPTIGFWRSTRQFGFFALDVTLAVLNRLGPSHHTEGVRYGGAEACLPEGLYADELMDSDASWLVLQLKQKFPEVVAGTCVARFPGSGAADHAVVTESVPKAGKRDKRRS